MSVITKEVLQQLFLKDLRNKMRKTKNQIINTCNFRGASSDLEDNLEKIYEFTNVMDSSLPPTGLYREFNDLIIDCLVSKTVSNETNLHLHTMICEMEDVAFMEFFCNAWADEPWLLISKCVNDLHTMDA